MSWLVWLHVVYACALVYGSRVWRDWNPRDLLQRVDQDDEDQPPSLFPPSNKPPPRTPITHAHNRVGLVVHLLCVVAATYACLRVQDAASLELQASGLVRPAGSSVASAAAASVLRHPNRDADDLIPIQRGGRRTVQQIMEQDVAHIVAATTPGTAKQPQQQQQRQTEQAGGAGTPAPLFAKDVADAGTNTAAPALLFHVLVLPMCLAHVILYSPWSWIDPRSATPTSRSQFLRPRIRALFQATACTGYLMQIVLMLALYCLLSTDLTGDSSASSVSSDVHASGLITGLLYVPFFMFHCLRFSLNAIFLWRWSLIFPLVASTAARALKLREKQLKQKGIKKMTPAAAAVEAVLDETSESKAKPASSSRRTAVRTQVAASSSSPTPRAIESDSESSESDADDADDSGEFDVGLLQEIASFAPADGPSVPLDPSVDPMAPSAIMQKLRNTPKLYEVLEKEQRSKKRSKKDE